MKMKHGSVCGILLAILLHGCAGKMVGAGTPSGKEMGTMKKPLYTLRVDVVAASFEVKVNDLPLLKGKGAQMATELPINHMLLSGENQVQVKIWPAEGRSEFEDHSRTEFSVYRGEVGDLRENAKVVAQAQFPDYRADPSKRKATLEAKVDFEAVVPSQPPWASCPILTLDSATIGEATRLFRTYYDAMEKKDGKRILALAREKNRHFAESYGSTLESREGEVGEWNEETWEDPENELIGFDVQQADGFTPSLHAGGRLITLVNVEGRSPLQYYNSEEGTTKQYPIYLGKKGGKLEILF